MRSGLGLYVKVVSTNGSIVYLRVLGGNGSPRWLHFVYAGWNWSEWLEGGSLMVVSHYQIHRIEAAKSHI